MAEERGSWRTFGERLVYDNRWVKVGLTDVQAPNGERWDYHVVHLARIAIALILNQQDEALMLWRYRFATEQWGYVLGGMVDDGEEAAITAAREGGWPGRVGAADCTAERDRCSRAKAATAARLNP